MCILKKKILLLYFLLPPQFSSDLWGGLVTSISLPIYHWLHIFQAINLYTTIVESYEIPAVGLNLSLTLVQSFSLVTSKLCISVYHHRNRHLLQFPLWRSEWRLFLLLYFLLTTQFCSGLMARFPGRSGVGEERWRQRLPRNRRFFVESWCSS